MSAQLMPQHVEREGNDHETAVGDFDVITPAPRTTWRRVIAGDPQSLPEQESAWVDAICSFGPYEDVSRLYRFADGREFVVPLVRRRGLLGAGRLYSYPAAWGMGGVVGTGQDTATLKMIMADLRCLGSLSLSIRPDPMQHDMWSTAVDATTTVVPRRGHVADLSGGWDAVESRMHKATRKYVRRAERAGVEVVVESGAALLDTYATLVDSSIQRWAARQNEPLALARWRAARRDPHAKLVAMAAALGRKFVVAIAYVDQQPAFGSIMLLGRTAHVTRSAMDVDRVGNTKAGSLVHWHLMKLAVQHGCGRYHLGESGASAKLAQFKEGFGAVPVDYAEYRLERLPLTKIDRAARTTVKKIIRFRDV